LRQVVQVHGSGHWPLPLRRRGPQRLPAERVVLGTSTIAREAAATVIRLRVR